MLRWSGGGQPRPHGAHIAVALHIPRAWLVARRRRNQRAVAPSDIPFRFRGLWYCYGGV